MKKPSINFDETPEERERIRAAQKGQNFNQTSDAARRWGARERLDEAFARSLGLNLDYDQTRTHNARLLR